MKARNLFWIGLVILVGGCASRSDVQERSPCAYETAYALDDDCQRRRF